MSTPNRSQNPKDAPRLERIAKVMARAGHCSRRDAEKLIRQGRVTFHGKRVETPSFCMKTEEARFLKIDSQPLKIGSTSKRVWRFHKPVGLLTTHRDPQGRQTIFDVLPQTMPRVVSVGRLDLNSQGLMLLTNHGGLSRFLELPSTGWKRHYRVRVLGQLQETHLNQLKKGLTLDGVCYGPIQARVDPASAGQTTGQNRWITLILSEGKNREIRRIMAHFGLKVSRLIRLSYGPFLLDHLSPGDVEEVPTHRLKGFLGKTWFEMERSGTD